MLNPKFGLSTAVVDCTMQDHCLRCKLDDCDESSPDCRMKGRLTSANKRWYDKLKDDPVRYEEYKRKKREIKRKWLQTPEGRALWSAQVKRYRCKHPDVMRRASARYHERNKEKRLRQNREYKRRQRLIRNSDRDIFTSQLH